jgi:flagellar assembly factor FliW
MNAFPATENVTEPSVALRSEVLGDITVPEETIFDFPFGVYGFEEARRFALLPAERDGMYWLQSLDFSALTFLLVDPFKWVEGYNVDLPDSELVSLAPADAADVAVLAIVTLPRAAGDSPTANLQGPVALNVRKRVGRQVVIQDSPFDVRHPVVLGD